MKILHGTRLSFLVALGVATAATAWGAAPSTAVRLQYAGTDVEGRQSFVLEWNAISNATYQVQQRASLDSGQPWQVHDVVVPQGTQGTYRITVPWIPANPGRVGSPTAFFRLILPEPAIFRVEPAVVSTAGGVVHVVGQCLPMAASRASPG